jgi:hypothetical protein
MTKARVSNANTENTTKKRKLSNENDEEATETSHDDEILQSPTGTEINELNNDDENKGED